MYTTNSTEEATEFHYPYLSRQVGGNHYKKMKIQVMEFCFANMTTEELTGVLKYVTMKYHWREKEDRMEDLEKSKHYMDMILAELRRRDNE